MIAESIYDLLPADWPKVIGDLPAVSGTVVGIIEYDGAQSTEYFGQRSTSSILKPLVKIVIRHSSYETGQLWATTAKQILHRYSGGKILSIMLVGAPMYLGRSVEKLCEFQTVFQIQVEE